MIHFRQKNRSRRVRANVRPCECCALALALFANIASAANIDQSALAPIGAQAQYIHTLWNGTLGISALVWVAIIAALVAAVVRSMPRSSRRASVPTDDRKVKHAVYAAVAVSTVLLIVLVLASFVTDRAIAKLPAENPLHIHVVGHQWWWEATYEDLDPAKRFTTANELHIPTGRTIELSLDADDVIHSLWVPRLNGKKDLIPSRTSSLSWRTDTPGVYRGQCAEFCGYQHAHMALVVVAEDPSAFDAWMKAQKQPASTPSESQALRGRDVFVHGTCAMCHTIEGTDAQAKHAPDLTHIASRKMLAAGTLENTPAMRAAWIADPQSFKPGANMPASNLSSDDLNAVLAYLATLK